MTFKRFDRLKRTIAAATCVLAAIASPAPGAIYTAAVGYGNGNEVFVQDGFMDSPTPGSATANYDSGDGTTATGSTFVDFDRISGEITITSSDTATKIIGQGYSGFAQFLFFHDQNGNPVTSGTLDVQVAFTLGASASGTNAAMGGIGAVALSNGTEEGTDLETFGYSDPLTEGTLPPGTYSYNLSITGDFPTTGTGVSLQLTVQMLPSMIVNNPVPVVPGPISIFGSYDARILSVLVNNDPTITNSAGLPIPEPSIYLLIAAALPLLAKVCAGRGAMAARRKRATQLS